MNETIPEDIREKAEAIVRGLCCDSCVFMAGCGCFDRITAVLMEEREICAQISDPIEYPGLAEASDIEKHAHDLRTLISRAIRRGTP